MKILCTKEEFAQMINDCAFNRIDGAKCEGCFFRDKASSGTDTCASLLMKSCEIVQESEAK